MARRLSGIASAWLIAYALMVGVVAILSFNAQQMIVPNSLMIAIHVPTMLVFFAVLVFFIRDSRRNPRLAARNTWTAMLFLLNLMVFPVYWWRYVREQSETGESGSAA